MMKHVRDVVFPFIKDIHDGEKTLFSEHMKDTVFMVPKPSLVQEAVGIIDELDISGQSSDVRGDIYEYLLSQLATAGKNGQFRTPRHIIRMMSSLLTLTLMTGSATLRAGRLVSCLRLTGISSGNTQVLTWSLKTRKGTGTT
ncbi:N-6 DNA methylase [Methanosarcina sp. DH2]|uniref:N-6 DNA methylase n=1 Tax=Methanosarcina sp. DH2 TaxID=2605639 RepID=UPI001E59182C|nr:N-6 DNA methylase [Methanosarcina sp. DH2]